MEFVKDRLIVLDAAESASHAKLEGLRADYKAAPVEERVDLRRELDEARARYKTVRSQIIALEAVLGAAAGPQSTASPQHALLCIRYISPQVHPLL